MPGAENDRPRIALRPPAHAGGRSPPATAFLLIVLWALGSALLRAALAPGLAVDDAREAELSQSLEIGYQKGQPPLYNWLVFGAVRVLGPGLPALLAVKYALLALTWALFHRLALRLSGDRGLAVLAAFSFLLVVPLGFGLHEALTHTVAAMPLVLATLAAALDLVDEARTQRFLRLGVAIGLGLLSKFTFLVFLAALVLAFLTLELGRRRLRDPRILLTAAIAIAIPAPFLVWILGEGFDYGTYLGDLVRFEGERPAEARVLLGLRYLGKCVLYATMPLALALVAFRRRRAATAPAAGRRLAERILAAELLLLAVAATLGLIGYLKPRWTIPLFFFWPLAAVARIDPAKVGARLRRRAGFVLAGAAAAHALALAASVLSAGRFERPSALSFPSSAVAAEVARLGASDAIIVAGRGPLAGNLRVAFPRATVVSLNHPSYRPPGVRAGRPLLLVWDKDEPPGPSAPAPPADLLALAASVAGGPLETSPPQAFTVPYGRSRRASYTFAAALAP